MVSDSSDEMLEQQTDTLEHIQESIRGLQAEYERGHDEHIQAINNMERRMSLLQIDQNQLKVTQGILQETQNILESQATKLEHEINTTKIDTSTSNYDQNKAYGLNTTKPKLWENVCKTWGMQTNKCKYPLKV